MKFTKEFFDTLGTYVYQYADPETDKPYYVGKGKGDRCIQHVRDKGYDSAHCHIVAKNLERFSKENPDAIAFAIESFIISQNPNLDNTVSGHYKECFIMNNYSLSSIFTEFKNSKTTGIEELIEVMNDHPLIKENHQVIETRATSFKVESGQSKSTTMSLIKTVGEASCKVRFSINGGTIEKHKELAEKLKNKTFPVEVHDTVVVASTYVGAEVPTLEIGIKMYEEFVSE